MRFHFQQLLAASISITSVLAAIAPPALPESTALATTNFLKPIVAPHAHEARALFKPKKKPGKTTPPKKDDTVELGESVTQKQQEVADRKALLEQKKAELEAARSRAAAATQTLPTVATTQPATVPAPTTLATVPTTLDKATTASPTTTSASATATSSSTTSTKRACSLRAKQTGAGGKVRRAPVNEGCEEPRAIYRIRMINDHANVADGNTDPDASAEAQDHCGIFIKDEPSKGGNSGTLHHAMYISEKQIKAYNKLNPNGPALAKDTYVYERKALTHGIVSKSARPEEYQTKLGEIESLAKLQIVEASMAPIGITQTNTGIFVLGTKSGGFTCQGWTREKLAILKTGRQISNWVDPPKVKSTDPDLPVV